MVWEVIRPWVSACVPVWRECKPEPSLDVSIQEFDAVLQQCSAGSHEIDRAIERLQKVAARADNWRVIGAAFKEGTDRKSMRALMASRSRHPSHDRAYQQSDFVRGLTVVNMLYTAGRQSQDAEQALRSDVIQQEQESIDDDSSIRGNGVS